MPDTTNGDGSPFNFDRKLDRINDTLASMTGLMQGSMQSMQTYMQVSREQHQMVMDEIRGLIELQKEQRIDIMALFEGNKNIRLALENLQSSVREAKPEA